MKHPLTLAGSVLVLMLSLQCYGQNQQQPATLRSLLLHELHTTHTEADWFVPISVAVDGLTAEQPAGSRRREVIPPGRRLIISCFGIGAT